MDDHSSTQDDIQANRHHQDRKDRAANHAAQDKSFKKQTDDHRDHNAQHEGQEKRQVPLEYSGGNDVGSYQQQFTLREVNNLAGFEDNGKTQSDECINTTLRDSGKKQLKKISHLPSCD